IGFFSCGGASLEDIVRPVLGFQSLLLESFSSVIPRKTNLSSEGFEMCARYRLSVRFLIPAVIGSLSFGAIVIQPSVERFRGSAAAEAVVSVNAASYVGPLAPATIAAAFGSNLATRIEGAQSLPLPTQLAGVTVRVIDANNVQHSAPLFFVSPGQVNYLIPEQAAPGAAQLIVNNGAGAVSQGQLQIATSSPAVFTASFSGRG